MHHLQTPLTCILAPIGCMDIISSQPCSFQTKRAIKRIPHYEGNCLNVLLSQNKKKEIVSA